MKYTLSLLPAIALLFVPYASQAATCTLNGEEVPCSELPAWLWALPVAAGVIGLLGFVFWVWMLIDAIKHEEENKLVWVVVLVVLNLLGAIIYYFLAKRARKQPSQENANRES